MSLMDMMRAGGEWLTPDRAAKMSALGQGLQGLGSGRPVNMNAAYDQLMQQERQTQAMTAMQESGVMERFTPQQQAILAQMPPQAAQSIIAQTLFAPTPQARIEEVNGQLVNIDTGEVVGDFRSPEAAPTTDDIREFQFAQSGGYSGSFNEWMTDRDAGRGTTVNMGPTGIDYGDPGAGLVWQRDQQGNITLDERGAPVAIPFQGGSAHQAQIEAEQAAVTAAEQDAGKDVLTERAGGVVLEDISRLADKIESAPWYAPAAGFGSGLFEGVRGSNAADAKALADTVRGNIGFDRLQQMRDASPTGGALGQVSQQELATLQSVLGSIELSQSEPQLLENLERLEEIYSGIMAKFAAYPNAEQFGVSGGAATPQAPPPTFDFSQIQSLDQMKGLDMSGWNAADYAAYNTKMDELGY